MNVILLLVSCSAHSPTPTARNAVEIEFLTIDCHGSQLEIARTELSVSQAAALGWRPGEVYKTCSERYGVNDTTAPPLTCLTDESLLRFAEALRSDYRIPTWAESHCLQYSVLARGLDAPPEFSWRSAEGWPLAGGVPAVRSVTDGCSEGEFCHVLGNVGELVVSDAGIYGYAGGSIGTLLEIGDAVKPQIATINFNEYRSEAYPVVGIRLVRVRGDSD